MIPTKENLEKLNKKKLKINKKISNNFIESTISKSNATALKIIYYLASKITEIDLETNYNTIQLDLKRMLEYTNLTRQNIRDNIKRMQQTSITFIDEENNIESGISLLPEYHFYWNKNRVDIVLNRKIAKLIVDVSKRYTLINTKELVRLKNKNSIRLLPILHMINGYNVKQKTLSISELNALFGTNYKKFVEMERGVLKKVKTELDDNSSLSFDYDINFESTGKGRPKAVSATLYPTLRKNYQTTIFSNLEYQSEESSAEKEHIETQEDYQKRLENYKINTDELSVHFGIAQMGDRRISLEFELYLLDKLEEFKKVFAVDRNFKDLDISFKKYIQYNADNKKEFFKKLK